MFRKSRSNTIIRSLCNSLRLLIPVHAYKSFKQITNFCQENSLSLFTIDRMDHADGSHGWVSISISNLPFCPFE